MVTTAYDITTYTIYIQGGLLERGAYSIFHSKGGLIKEWAYFNFSLKRGAYLIFHS